MAKDGRREEQIAEADDMQGFLQLNAEVIDVASITIKEAAALILDIIT
ncbi:MAG: hypothetical protein FWE76_00630 [Symbiobacteriaceae bacterium]|nr:hypothetical protein [Symbiobacteriaceae bacterium]